MGTLNISYTHVAPIGCEYETDGTERKKQFLVCTVKELGKENSVCIDAVSRLVPGVLNNEASAEFESFQDNLLEYPQYTRPEEYEGRKVPEVLLSGHHANIEKWRREKSIERTLAARPDLLADAVLSKKEKQYLDKLLAMQRQEEE